MNLNRINSSILRKGILRAFIRSGKKGTLQADDKPQGHFWYIIFDHFTQIIFVFLSFALMVVVSYLFVSDIVKDQLYGNVRKNLQIADERIVSDFQEVEIVLANLEIYAKENLGKSNGIEEVKSYVTSQTATLMAAENRVLKLSDVFVFYEGMILSATSWEQAKDYDPYNRPWYATALNAGGEIGITPIYTAANTHGEVIALCKTIKIPGTGTQGIIALNIDFSYISEYVKSLSFAEGSYGILVDENYRFIVHPNDANLGRPLEDVNASYAQIVHDFRNKKELDSASALLINTEGVRVVVVFQHLSKISNNWLLGIAIPVATYFQDIRLMAVVLSILGVVFVVILNVILIQLSLSKVRSDEENKSKSSFLARMSHEIRTPMNSILGMAELIQWRAETPEIQEYIGILRQSGQNLMAIINGILDFSRIESNQLQIEKRKYYLASVINDVVNIIRPRAVEKSLDFFVNMGGAIPAELVGDDGRLRQILSNLLTNAVKYTPKGYISLDVTIEDIADKEQQGNKKLVFSVRDSGIGIKEEDTKRLFTEFSRVDGQANKGIEGTGLGLVIIRALCRAMGGDVTVSSEYGKGSVFQASLIQQGSGDPRPVAQVNNPETKRVLFFDWRPMNVEILTGIFKTLGVHAECSGSLDEFLHALKTGDYNYAFISSKHAMDCIEILEKRSSSLQLVIMAEMGRVSVFRDVSSIMMPVYSVSVANILNNNSVDEDPDHQNTRVKIHFIAPEARVLIVDDINTNLRVAKELMSPYNMQIDTCLSGEEAVKMVKRTRYDLVFMDHMMPGMDGVETTAHIRTLDPEDAYFRELPVVALTANAITGQREKLLEQGINDFLSKPIDTQKLNTILEKWLPEEKRVESSGEQRKTDTDNLETVLITGLDTVLGLRNCGDSREAYFDILDDFCRDAQSRSSKIHEALETGDTGLYVTLVHALKGAAWSVGATETGELALWLEKSAENEDPALIRSKTADFLEKLQVLCTDIQNIIQKTAGGAESGDISALNLDALKTALQELNVEAVNKTLMEYTHLSLNKETKNKIAQVEELILMFEYDSAVKKIDELF